MQKVEFIKIERACDYNDRLKRDGGPTRDIIRDFQVVINGEHRATWKRVAYSKGYDLYDLLHQSIKERDDWRSPARADAQSDFVRRTAALLTLNRIPTLSEIKMDRLRNAAKAENARFDQHIENVKHAKEKFAPEMVEIIMAVRDANTPVLEQQLVDRARKVLEEIDAQVAIWDRNDERGVD